MALPDPVAPAGRAPRRLGGRLTLYGLTGLALVAIMAACLFRSAIAIPVPTTVDGHGCADIPTGYALRDYGVVRDCRLLRARAHLFSSRGPSAYLLLDTESGLVSLRVDYENLDAGRQFQSTAQELPPADTPGLNRSERDRLAADLAARGGHLDAWTLHYGDG